jgi:hypothetical protein
VRPTETAECLLLALSEQSRHRNILVAIGLTADKVGFWLGILGAALQADFVVAFVARQSHHIGSYERRLGATAPKRSACSPGLKILSAAICNSRHHSPDCQL